MPPSLRQRMTHEARITRTAAPRSGAGRHATASARASSSPPAPVSPSHAPPPSPVPASRRGADPRPPAPLELEPELARRPADRAALRASGSRTGPDLGQAGALIAGVDPGTLAAEQRVQPATGGLVVFLGEQSPRDARRSVTTTPRFPAPSSARSPSHPGQQAHLGGIPEDTAGPRSGFRLDRGMRPAGRPFLEGVRERGTDGLPASSGSVRGSSTTRPSATRATTPARRAGGGAPVRRRPARRHPA